MELRRHPAPALDLVAVHLVKGRLVQRLVQAAGKAQRLLQWAGIFNNDSVLTSALLDRLLHHADTVSIEGRSDPSKEADHLEA